MRACVCQALLYGDLKRPRNRLYRKATLHNGCYTLPAGSAHNPGTVKDSSTGSGKRVIWTVFGWACNASLLPCLSLVWDTVKQSGNVNFISIDYMSWRSSRGIHPFSHTFHIIKLLLESHFVSGNLRLRYTVFKLGWLVLKVWFEILEPSGLNIHYHTVL